MTTRAIRMAVKVEGQMIAIAGAANIASVHFDRVDMLLRSAEAVHKSDLVGKEKVVGLGWEELRKGVGAAEESSIFYFGPMRDISS